MPYFTNLGPKSGPILYRDGHDAIGVLQARDNHWPIGMALGTGWDDRGRKVSRLTVHRAKVREQWIAVDREFRPAG
jgi:hypothetical protein